MPFNHPKLNILSGGWYVVFKNGDVLTEEELSWNQVPNKKDITIMGLKRHNKYYEIEGKESYMPPGETHMRELCMANPDGLSVTKQTLVGWFIGYYDVDGKVYWRVDATTGKFYEEKIPYVK